GRKMIEIDGSFGEGGGQVLRTAVALATVLSKEINVFNIRSGRAEPGIRPQHMTGVKAAAELCSANLQGLEVGATEFVFKPGKLRTGNFRFDVGTAGSVTLVLQTLMPILAFAPGPVQLEITGGTDVKWSPPIDYVRLVTLPILKKIGYRGHLETVRWGQDRSRAGRGERKARGGKGLDCWKHPRGRGRVGSHAGPAHARHCRTLPSASGSNVGCVKLARYTAHHDQCQSSGMVGWIEVQ